MPVYWKPKCHGKYTKIYFNEVWITADEKEEAKKKIVEFRLEFGVNEVYATIVKLNTSVIISTNEPNRSQKEKKYAHHQRYE